MAGFKDSARRAAHQESLTHLCHHWVPLVRGGPKEEVTHVVNEVVGAVVWGGTIVRAVQLVLVHSCFHPNRLMVLRQFLQLDIQLRPTHLLGFQPAVLVLKSQPS